MYEIMEGYTIVVIAHLEPKIALFFEKWHNMNIFPISELVGNEIIQRCANHMIHPSLGLSNPNAPIHRETIYS